MAKLLNTKYRHQLGKHKLMSVRMCMCVCMSGKIIITYESQMTILQIHYFFIFNNVVQFRSQFKKYRILKVKNEF